MAVDAATSLSPLRLRRLRIDWTGIAFAVILTVVVVFPLVVVGGWAFTEVWRYPAIIPQEFGLKFWQQTLARSDVWTAITTSVSLSVVDTGLSELQAQGRKIERNPRLASGPNPMVASGTMER